MAVFSQKHYEAIADLVKQERIKQIQEFNGYGGKALEDLAYRMCEFFEQDNRNFSRVKFLEVALSK